MFVLRLSRMCPERTSTTQHEDLLLYFISTRPSALPYSFVGYRSYTMRHPNKTVCNRSPTVVQTQQHPTLTVDIHTGVVYKSRTR